MSDNKDLTTFYESRVSIYDLENRIIKFDQVPILSEESICVCFGKINEVSQQFDSFYLLINLTNTHRPNAFQRKLITEQFQSFKDRTLHCSVYTHKNKIINIAAYFVMQRVGFNSYSIDKGFDDAIKRINKHINSKK